ncbi:hypothetical protein BH24ACI4_BH24ACI4_13680 [soil metagenome]
MSLTLNAEQFADLLVEHSKRLIAGPKVGGRFESLEARIAALEERPIPTYRGTHEAAKTYASNSLVTRGGSLWIAMQATTSVPGTDSSWKLIVKKGGA